MLVTLMKSKIHNATITHADLHYEGSITIDQELMELARIFKGERVQIVNLNNGERLETYVIVGERGSGVVGINGPAALKNSIGDHIHIISYALINGDEADNFSGRVLILKSGNVVKEMVSA